MTPTTSLLVTAGTTLLSSFLFILCGLWFVSKFTFEPRKITAFQIAAGFFIGGSLFLGCYRTFGQFTQGLNVPLGAASGIVLIFAAAALPRLKESLTEFCQWRCVFWCIVAALLVEAFILTYWLTPPWFPRDAPFEFVGTLHSGRYVGLAEYIVKNSRIPVIGQNYGQALLASISLLAGGNSPYLALHLWLVAHVCALLLLVFGFFKMTQHRTSVAIAAACITALGSSALSVSSFNLIDSGNPWLMNGYSDSIAGLSTFLIFLILCLEKKNQDPRFLVWGSVLLAIFTLRWGMGAPQNILLMLVLLASAFALRVVARRGWTLQRIIIFSVVLCAFMALGRRQGGMLTPRALQEDIKLVGMLNLERDPAQGKQIHIVPYLKHFLVSAADELKFVEHPTKESAQKFLLLLERKTTDIEVWPALVAMSEEYLLAALRAMFWPIAGTAASILIGLRARRYASPSGPTEPSTEYPHKASTQDVNPPYLFGLGLINLVVLGAGFAGCFLFEVNGYKWELTRFMIPGYGMGMLLVVGSAAHLLERCAPPSRARHWLFTLAALTCFGPATFLAFTCIRNMSSVAGGFSFQKRLERLITLRGTGVSKTEYSANIQGLLNNAVQIASQRIAFGGVFTPFSLVLRGTSISIEETNVNLENSEQFNFLLQKLEALKLQAPFEAVALVDLVHETNSGADDYAFLVTIEHVDADPGTYKIPFKRLPKNVEVGGVYRTDAAQRFLPWK